MPRRQYIADLQKAQEGVLPPHIHDLQPGDDDGVFEFVFVENPSDGVTEAIKITAMIADLSEYPKSHEFMIFCDDNATPAIGNAVAAVGEARSKSIFELTEIVSNKLLHALSGSSGDTQMTEPQSDDDDELDIDDDSETEIYGDDYEVFGLQAQITTPHAQPSRTAPVDVDNPGFRSRIKEDLRTTKAAGFKVGHLGHLMHGHNSFVTVSVRVSKLGISEEAMKAWQILEDDYLILLIQYPNGYKTNEELQGFDGHRLAQNIGMRVCLSKLYKPTLEDAIKAFSVAQTGNPSAASQDVLEESTIRETFISRPLTDLLEKRLPGILRFRSEGMSWRGAEEWYVETGNKRPSDIPVAPAKHYQDEPMKKHLPDILMGDHYTLQSKAYSFPLLAMQFMLRHFVHCTDFCLVCHCKLDTDLEALKPYVCDKDLCLYQYMALGFGPSLEHEILAQPYVVDLLVSFCYSSASSGKLKEFPDGLDLTIPPDHSFAKDLSIMARFNEPFYGRLSTESTPPRSTHKPETDLQVRVDLNRREIIFDKPPETCPVRKGNWIVLILASHPGTERHCRVSDVNFYPTIKFDDPIVFQPNIDPHQAVGNETVAKHGSKLGWEPASFQVYDQSFKELSKGQKNHTICKLLSLLPSVTVLQHYLRKQGSPDLKQWVERIPPATLSVFRWVIASNRACIMQVDNGKNDPAGNGSPGKAQNSEKIDGLPGYMQFRFAMGAPDKEQRFIDEVIETTKRLKLQYPTLFAWHGSPLCNWHTIIREGLHFDTIANGRAFGNGVYHSPHFTTSTGYARAGMSTGIWKNSVLTISSALALNEIVNAPVEFTSQTPHFVVQKLDWIQTRYLFVQCKYTGGNNENTGVKMNSGPYHPQDPSHTAMGPHGQIQIPASAIKSQIGKLNKKPPGQESASKRRKSMNGKYVPLGKDEGYDDDTASVATLDEDKEILLDDPIEAVATLTLGSAKKADCKTDFVPGQLDWTKLPLMPVPEYANTATTKRLMQEINALRKVQEATPLGDLGWFMDFEKMENNYQWIVELHSFHLLNKELKLVKDMKTNGIKSIVLEIRFNKDFPYTPPYIRVVRPRFLGFKQGGGGHIVLGGAMCMELLTNTGWSSVSTMESVLMQVRLAIASDPPAKIDMHNSYDYGTQEAAEGYLRACNAHGWAVPPGFKEMAFMTASKTNANGR